MPDLAGQSPTQTRPMEQTITTREMENADLPDVVELLRLSLGDSPTIPKSMDLFTWKHISNPFGRSIAIVAESGDRLVGLRAFMKWDLVTDQGSTIRCVRAVDTATHPDFQRRGIFRRLTEEAVEVANSRDIDLIFNTPNEKSGAGYLKMGWVEVGKINPMVRPSIRLLERGVPGPDIGLGGHLAGGREVADPPMSDRPARGLRTPRSPEYWHWRFRSHPAARYAEVGSSDARAVVRIGRRRGRRELMISEISGEPYRAIGSVVKASRAQYTATWFSPGSPERGAAMRRLHISGPGTGSMTLVARPLRDLGIDVTSMRTWDFSVSDLELL